MVEHLTENQGVPSSSLGLGTFGYRGGVWNGSVLPQRGNSAPLFRRSTLIYGSGISSILGFRPGPKKEQGLYIPEWIKLDTTWSRWCLRGLFETDGYLHYRRGRERSVVVGLSSTDQALLDDVQELLLNLGYTAFRRSPTSVDCWQFDEVMRFIAHIGFDKS